MLPQDLGEKLKDFDKSTSTVAAKDDKLRTTTRWGKGEDDKVHVAKNCGERIDS